ncbi:unnamed protein product [Cylindrotheca closterium]|uniref:GOLD domain-containing protein n=1 Tax=Cylindrotheca closterium TaxID=2856 RepID=A0AAD2FMR3_9STRA|nr:unnamed protein product [Cylindrotheca closterium]
MKAIMKSLLLLSAGFIWSAKGHPMIIELQENEERCINLNIPEDDDAHLIFLPLPSEAETTNEWIKKYEDLEQHFLGQIVKLTKSRMHSSLPKQFVDDPPADIKAIMDELVHEWYEGETNSMAEVKLTNPHTQGSTTMETHWFHPLVLNHLRRILQHNQQRDKAPLEGYEICITSKNEEVPILMMIEHVMTSDDIFDDEEDTKSGMMFKSEHLTPLQDQLDGSIHAANTVIRELNLMEKREKRMRKTADSINWRVRNFSYLSVIVLILVTFFQVTYLKRYFKKKKLL